METGEQDRSGREIQVALVGSWGPLTEGRQELRVGRATVGRAPRDLRGWRGLPALQRPDWLLGGEGMTEPELLQALRVARATLPAIRLAVLGPLDDPERCECWMRRGALVYLRHAVPASELVEALLYAMTGEKAVLEAAFVTTAGVQLRGLEESQPDALTPRETEVLRLIGHGLSNAAIAARLQVSNHTVESHLASLYKKLGVLSRGEAAQRARRMGIL